MWITIKIGTNTKHSVQNVQNTWMKGREKCFPNTKYSAKLLIKWKLYLRIFDTTVANYNTLSKFSPLTVMQCCKRLNLLENTFCYCSLGIVSSSGVTILVSSCPWENFLMTSFGSHSTFCSDALAQVSQAQSTTSTDISPRESCRRKVSLELRKGMWFCLTLKAWMTSPRHERDLLMFWASFRRVPSAPDLLTRSDPARSTRFNRPAIKGADGAISFMSSATLGGNPNVAVQKYSCKSQTNNKKPCYATIKRLSHKTDCQWSVSSPSHAKG